MSSIPQDFVRKPILDMAEKDAPCDDVESNDSSENQSSGEWTIIGRFSKNDDTDEDIARAEDISDRQGPKGLEILEPDKNELDVETNDNNEDSDGISVITESETEQLIINKKFGEIDDCNSSLCRVVQKREKPGKKTASQAGTILNVVIACSLAAIMGLGAGRILDMYNECSISDALDFSTINLESETLIRQLKELSEVREVLDDIKASFPKTELSKEHKRRCVSDLQLKRSRRTEKLSDEYVFDPDTTILEQLQISLNTLYSVIDGIDGNKNSTDSDVSKARSVMMDLLEFKKTLNIVITEIEGIGRPGEIAFLRHAEKKIKDISKLLLADLTFTIHGLTMKIQHKLNKVRHKLNKRLCMLRNTESKEQEFFKSLAVNNSFLDSCEKILNLSLKSTNFESTKLKKQDKTYRKLAQRMPAMSQKKSFDGFKSKPESKPDDSEYSTSDSSIPDLVYIHDKNFWNKRPLVELQAQPIDLKITLNDRKSSQVDTGSNESHDRQCSKNVITDELFHVETRPIPQESPLKPESVHQKIIKSEDPGIPSNYPKPLYSTVLRTVFDAGKAEQDNAINVKSPGGQISEVVESFTVEETTQEKEQMADAENKGKKKIVHPRNNVNLTQIEDNVRNAECSKLKPNINVQDSTTKYDEVSEDDAIRTPNYGARKKSQYIKEKSAASSNKYCREGQTCPNEKSTPTESHKSHSKTRSEKSDKKSGIEAAKKNEKMKLGKRSISTKIVKKLKNGSNDRKGSNDMTGEWQMQRSRAREGHRDNDRRSEWLFDRANSRRGARNEIGTDCNDPFCQSKKYQALSEDENTDKDFYDYWPENKDMNSRKHANSRAGFTAKKIKSTHKKNMRRTKHT